jgi:hypothetical protein
MPRSTKAAPMKIALSTPCKAQKWLVGWYWTT